MIGALGACFGRVVTMDSPQGAAAGRVPVGSDAVARAGARHHAADVEPARAALADRRHLGLRGEEGAPRVGPRDGRRSSPAMLNRGETLKLRDLNAAFTEPEDDLARLLPGVAARRAHRQRLRRRRAAQAAARLRRRARHRRGAEGGARTPTSTRCRPASTRRSSRCSARMRARAGGAGATSELLRRCRSTTLQDARGRATRAASRCRWRSAARCARPASSTRRCRRSSARRRWCRWPAAPDSPHEQMAEIALEKKDTRARDRRAARRWSPSTSTTSTRRASWPTLLRRGRRRRSGEARAGLPAHRRDRSVRRRRARDARPLRDGSATTPTRAAREFRAVLALDPVDRAAAHTDLAESYFKARQARRSEEADARGARDRAELRARAGSAAEAGGGATVSRGGVAAARGARRRSALLTLVPALQPRVDAQLPTAADDRFAGLQWRFVRIKYHYTTEGTRVAAGFLRRAVGHRRAGGRAEPVAPHQDGDRDPGRGSDPADARRPAAVRATRGSTSSSRAACGCTTARCRSCASSCCAAARRCSTTSTARSSGTTSSSEMKQRVSRPRDRRGAEGSSGLQLLLQDRRLSAGRRPRLVPRRAAPGRRAASSPHLRTILDDTGRPMMFINWNTDMGDGWEWSNAAGVSRLHQVHRDGLSHGHQRNRLRPHALRTA